ncbi:MAG: hypothetical protein ACLQU3_14410 [Limisphaerales bacterium]
MALWNQNTGPRLLAQFDRGSREWVALPRCGMYSLGDPAVGLTSSAEAGGRFRLQYNRELSSSNWTSLNNAVTATGATLNSTNSATSSSRRFHPVMLLQGRSSG